MRTTLFCILAAAVVIAAAARDVMLEIEHVHVPDTWVRQSSAKGDETIQLQFALKWKHPNSIEQELDKTSDPDSPEYLQHLSKDQVLEMLKPADNATETVKNYLQQSGVPKKHIKSSATGDWVLVKVPARHASALLGDAKFSVYRHKESQEEIVRTTRYTLPQDIAAVVDFVSGITHFSSQRTQRRPSFIVNSDIPEPATHPEQVLAASDADTETLYIASESTSTSTCNISHVSSECLRHLYGTTDYTPQAPQKTHVGIAGFLHEYANYADLDLFLREQRPEALAGKATFDYLTINGEHDNQTQSAAGGEANLDVQVVIGMTWPVRTSFISVGGSPAFRPDNFSPKNTNEPYAALLQYLLEQDANLPDVLSISYGDDEQTVPPKYARRVCSMFAALGLRGVSVFVASGDEGVGGKKASHCQTNDGEQKETFLPNFPGSCPYVTVVGATQGFNPEAATSKDIAKFYSGGGFSYYFARPKYQDNVVPQYIKDVMGNQYAHLYNQSGRAYPDISAQGSRYSIALNNSMTTESGTSASTPLVASIFSLLNDARFAKGKPSLGFVNPLLYKRLSQSNAFNDVTEGSATGCGNKTGFKAAPGWDAVTGFGTPRFKMLLRNVVDL
ncbi:tripeptidyl-peptidase I [Malassezia vespertilionis]|uniref:tripeptidyl-peptidase II n=1 Tax=Malassezia vespertilionis TaxID=2020962 RepID=A0A2N1JG23_9BASI|nr:tripeptidyl-peptidase I [Malassezia vespertilionis]PKI85504.1 hypothetical protein MVES_000455 [Malassezia vespertilionis]WFD05166.1 tripeptidyl-peptidase I [Malassezia vespertilionis]